MRTAEEFQQFYRTALVPELKPLEALRKSTRNKILLTGLGFLVLAIIGLAIFPASVVFIAVGFLFVQFFISKRYKASFKDIIISKIAKFVEPALSYIKEGFIPAASFDESGIFSSNHNRYNGDDYIRGVVNGVKIESSELDVRHVTGSGKNRREQTIFQGIFFIADFNKSFKGDTFVLPDVAEKYLGRLGTFLQSKNPARDELVKLENPEFEKEFVVYGDDQVEARYILSPSLMERILKLNEKTGKDLRIAFKNSKIYIAVSHSPIFEPKIFSTILNFEPIENYYEDLSLILGIIDDLNLNTKIWGV